MKQVLQSLADGRTEVVDVPVPVAASGRVLIRSRASVVSSGTERMLVDFGKANLLEKALQQPERVRQVVEKIATDGVAPTIHAVRSKLSRPLAMGYANAGVVIGVGPGVRGFSVGDSVVSNGPHAEVVSVPANLCVRFPQTGALSFEEAAFTPIAAIALQGIRLVQPSLGECVVVTGLGLVGLLTVQLLRSHGCHVLGIDMDSERLRLARAFGAATVDLSAGEDPLQAAARLTRDRGVDAVIITASTKSSEPVHQAATMCRKRGRIVLVGVTGLELSRADFYEKELTFQVSCSYGPGRYDPEYEEGGRDYPFGFVRWTEGRNFEAVLDMLAERRIDVAPLISHRFSIDEAAEAYATLTEEPSRALGIVLNYPQPHEPAVTSQRRTVTVSASPNVSTATGGATVGVIGAGNFALQVLLPALQRSPCTLRTIVSNTGLSSVAAARRFGFLQASTDVDEILSDPSIDTVFIATRHDSHASLAIKALERRKHVFVEKPLVISRAELRAVEAAYGALAEQGRAPVLTVGFNRRFAPFVVEMRSLLEGVRAPLAVSITVNAGELPADHWLRDPEIGGGRLIGEGCHFVDLVRFLVGGRITGVHVASTRAAADPDISLALTFADGSVGTIQYLTSGHRSFPKERVEIFAGGRILALDNFRTLRTYGWRGAARRKARRQDKGHGACVNAFLEAASHGSPNPIPFDELIEVMDAVLDAADVIGA